MSVQKNNFKNIDFSQLNSGKNKICEINFLSGSSLGRMETVAKTAEEARSNMLNDWSKQKNYYEQVKSKRKKFSEYKLENKDLTYDMYVDQALQTEIDDDSKYEPVNDGGFPWSFTINDLISIPKLKYLVKSEEKMCWHTMILNSVEKDDPDEMVFESDLMTEAIRRSWISPVHQRTRVTFAIDG
jgi:hypothetical protein